MTDPTIPSPAGSTPTKTPILRRAQPGRSRARHGRVRDHVRRLSATWPGCAASVTSPWSVLKAPARRVLGSPATSPATTSGSSRCNDQTASSVAVTASLTPPTRSAPPAPCSPGEAAGAPKTADGSVEAIRLLCVARRRAIKARTQAANQMHAVLTTAPSELRTTLTGLNTKRLVDRCAHFRTEPAGTPLGAARRTFRILARRWQAPLVEFSL